jgi:hypothetical protein
MKEWLIPLKGNFSLDQAKCEGDVCGPYSNFEVSMFSGNTLMDDVMFYFMLSSGFVVFAFIFVFLFFWF